MMAAIRTEAKPVDVVLDSLSRDTGTADYPGFNFDPKMLNVVGVQPLWVNIPYSYYVIDRNCNDFQITATNSGVDTVTQVFLQPGTYNPETLAYEFKRALSSSVTYAGIDYEVFMDPVTAHFTIYNPTFVDADKFTIQVDNDYLASILGFVAGTPYPSSLTAVWQSGVQQSPERTNGIHAVQAPGLLNLAFSSLINVFTGFTRTVPSITRSQTDKDNIIGKAPVNTNFLGYIFYQFGNEVTKIPPTKIDFIKVYLQLSGRTSYAALSKTPTNNDFVNTTYLPLNGQGFQIAIRFWVDEGVIR